MAQSEAPKKRKRPEFRLNCKNLFLTWPKNNCDPCQVCQNLIQHFGVDNMTYVCVSQEEHEDGSPHLHALVCLKKKCNITSAANLDKIGGGKHGNYQSAKNVKDVHDYVKKGGLFFEHGSCPVKPNETKSKLVAVALLSGKGLEHVIEMDPGFSLLHLRTIKEFQNEVKMMNLKKKTKPPPLIYSAWGHQIEIGLPREFKQPQYWIWGSPNTGKTSFINDLTLHGFTGYQIPLNDDHCEWDDDLYDFAYVDEFHGQLSITFLNQFLQGSALKMNVKGRSTYKRVNIPTFILSNFSPETAWKNVSPVSLHSLKTRLHILYTG